MITETNTELSIFERFPLVTGVLYSQNASNAASVSMSWPHHKHNMHHTIMNIFAFDVANCHHQYIFFIHFLETHFLQGESFWHCRWRTAYIVECCLFFYGNRSPPLWFLFWQIASRLMNHDRLPFFRFSNTLRPRQNGRHFSDNIYKGICEWEYRNFD